MRNAQTNAIFCRLAPLAAAAGLLICMQASAQQGDPQAGQAKAALCSACHGADGNSVTPDWPSLAGQHVGYSVKQLLSYQNGERSNVVMQGPAATLTPEDMADISAFYAAQTLQAKGADPELTETGERIYRGGIPERGIAACIACHGPSGRGNPLADYPRIAGQHSAYVFNTLQDYASGERRSDSDVEQMMRNVSELLLEDEMRALASYVQGLQ